jgi:hypothetical protein
LTLNGDSPSSHSDKDGTDISEIVYCVSYKYDIINWLERCMKEVYDKPLILYSIKQYQNLIKLITNQSINKIMSKELIDTIFNNSKNIKNALRVINYKKEIGIRLTNLIIEEVKKIGITLKIDISSNDLEKLKNSGIYDIEKRREVYLVFETKENKKIRATIQFNNEGQDKYFIGIAKIGSKYDDIQSKIKSLEYNFFDPSNYKKPKENWYYGKSFFTNDFIEYTNSIEETEPIKFFKDCVEICSKIKNS